MARIIEFPETPTTARRALLMRTDINEENIIPGVRPMDPRHRLGPTLDVP